MPEKCPLDIFPLWGRKASGGRLFCADRSGAETVSAKPTDEGNRAKPRIFIRFFVATLLRITGVAMFLRMTQILPVYRHDDMVPRLESFIGR